MANKKISRNDPCPCGSGLKYKKCCYGKDSDSKDSEKDHERKMFQHLRGALAAQRRKTTKYPVGTLAMYGPDDKTTTKIAAGVIQHENAEPIMMRWVATDVTTNPKIQGEIQAFFDKYGVKSVAASDGNMGCPHEEGEDFPLGEDCPFCPFWKGKQGSNQKD